MRKDIEFNTHTHDVKMHTSSQNPRCKFEWLATPNEHLRARITLPDTYFEEVLAANGIHLFIPYTPVFENFQVQFVVDGEAQLSEALREKWFDVYVRLYNTEKEERVYASELGLIDIDDDFILHLSTKKVYVWSGKESDFKNTNANFQNGNLLLQCVPSNSYRYPISGVGLVKYINSNMTQSNLGGRLQSEFNKDGVVVKNAELDSENGELDLQLDFSRLNGDIYN